MITPMTNQRSMSKALSDFLKYELELRQWTRQDAAEHLGLSQTAITTLILNPERQPTLETLRAIADGLKQPFSRLLALAGYPVEREALTPSSLTLEEEAFIGRLSPEQRRLALEIVRQMLGESLTKPEP